MRALVVEPGRSGTLTVEERPDPRPGRDELLVAGVALGVCGTDREIVGGRYGWAPPGGTRLVLGHESLGRVVEAPDGSGFAPGDLVAGVVRRPDPVPCGACERGQWDMCRNGRYTERGIKELDGYGSELWVVPSRYAVRVPPGLGLAGVLTEPTSVVAKAWEQVERVGGRAWFEPTTVLVTGAGPIGLLGAMMGVQRGLDVHVLDRVTEGPKPDLVRALGATYHSGSVDDAVRAAPPDVVIEATGASSVVLDVLAATKPYGVVCLTGVSAAGRTVRIDAGALNRELVLENDAVIGSVNANLAHYEAAVDALGRADRAWLRSLVTTVPMERAADAFAAPPADGVKTAILLTAEETP